MKTSRLLLMVFYMNRGSIWLLLKIKKYFFKRDRSGYLTFEIIYCPLYDLKTLIDLSLGKTALTIIITKYKKTNKHKVRNLRNFKYLFPNTFIFQLIEVWWKRTNYRCPCFPYTVAMYQMPTCGGIIRGLLCIVIQQFSQSR